MDCNTVSLALTVSVIFVSVMVEICMATQPTTWLSVHMYGYSMDVVYVYVYVARNNPVLLYGCSLSLFVLIVVVALYLVR